MNLNERNESMKSFFNLKAEECYDEVHAAFMGTKRMITEKLSGEPKKILDLGGGTGLELIYLFERFPDAQVTVVDISENMLKILSKRPFASKITTVCGNFFEVELGKEYDAVISTSALHHFMKDDKLRLFEKVHSCLKDGGEFINSDKFADNPEDEALCLADYYENKDKRPHIDTPLSVETEVSLLEKVGFGKIEVFKCDVQYYNVIKTIKI